MPRNKARSVRVEAIVLKHSDFGEADRVLTLYSREEGKLRAIAKGARKTHSRKAGHVEPFSQVRLQLARGKNFFIVSQAEAINTHTVLAEDLERLGYASYVVELLERFSVDEDANQVLYRLLRDTLNRLEDKRQEQVAIRFYEIQLLDQLGFRPELHECLNCNKDVQAEDQFFSAQRGGVLCPDCGPADASAHPISMEALKYLRHFQRSDYGEALRAQMSQAVRIELEILMNHYLTYLLEKRLNSPRFLRRVRRERS
jgi:DNA repair protein RecO (recombination protein O)